MRPCVLILGFCILGSHAAEAHDIITTKITWNRELSRIVYARCASCHRDGGLAFSLMTYEQARPWAKAIKEEVLERRMPPWGGVKGFGEFRNDQALTQEQLELIAGWVEGGAPEGEPKDLPPPPKLPPPMKTSTKGGIDVSGDFKLPRAFTLDGLWPQALPDNQPLQITAEFPDGSVEPLLWLRGYKTEFGHPFLLRTPLQLPAGTTIQGVPNDAHILLMPVGSAPAPKATR